MTFDEWWLKEADGICRDMELECQQEGLSSSLRHYMEIAWLEGYASAHADSEASEEA